jgi:hypothetical protein
MVSVLFFALYRQIDGRHHFSIWFLQISAEFSVLYVIPVGLFATLTRLFNQAQPRF